MQNLPELRQLNLSGCRDTIADDGKLHNLEERVGVGMKVGDRKSVV